MFSKVFPLNLAPRETYKKTQRSPKYDWRLQNKVHPCESLELAAILDDILDFEKCSRVSPFHQADFVYVLSLAAKSIKKYYISQVRVRP